MRLALQRVHSFTVSDPIEEGYKRSLRRIVARMDTPELANPHDDDVLDLVIVESPGKPASQGTADRRHENAQEIFEDRLVARHEATDQGKVITTGGTRPLSPRHPST